VNLGCPCPCCRPPRWKTRQEVEEERRRELASSEERRSVAVEQLRRLGVPFLQIKESP
jgi:hypothetical protein